MLWNYVTLRLSLFYIYYLSRTKYVKFAFIGNQNIIFPHFSGIGGVAILDARGVALIPFLDVLVTVCRISDNENSLRTY